MKNWSLYVCLYAHIPTNSRWNGLYSSRLLSSSQQRVRFSPALHDGQTTSLSLHVFIMFLTYAATKTLRASYSMSYSTLTSGWSDSSLKQLSRQPISRSHWPRFLTWPLCNENDYAYVTITWFVAVDFWFNCACSDVDEENAVAISNHD